MTAASPPVAPNADLDRCARVAGDLLAVPVSSVGVPAGDELILAGAVGLAGELDDARRVPLADALCQYVIRDDLPLVVSDARLDHHLRDLPGVAEGEVVAYLGMPLHDEHGAVAGSLCAVDTRPRTWTAAEQRSLRDLSRTASAVLREQLARRPASHASFTGDDGVSSARSEVLLRLSEALAGTVSTPDVTAAVGRAAGSTLGCTRAGIWFAGDDRRRVLRHLTDPTTDWLRARAHRHVGLDRPHPIAATHRTGRAMFFTDLDERNRYFPDVDPDGLPGTGHASAFAPLVVEGQALGCLVMVWDEAHRFSFDERATVAALATYTAQAVHRAHLLEDRASAASVLQAALLADLPTVPGLEVAARYRTAGPRDAVGGDWYDVVAGRNGGTDLVVGDVAGHDVRAAAVMGQLRSMLRAFTWAPSDAAPSGTAPSGVKPSGVKPSEHVRSLDRAVRDLGLRACASLIFARLSAPEPAEPDGAEVRRLQWTNAGHLPPLLLRTDGEVRTLTDGTADLLVGVEPDVTRRDHEVQLRAGDTVLLYTDGLIETRDESLDDGIARLRTALERHRAGTLAENIDAVIDEVVAIERHDDIAVLAVRVTG